jgi:hypothetical protein
LNRHLDGYAVPLGGRVGEDADRVSDVRAVVEEDEAQLRVGREVVDDELLGGCPQLG